MLKPKTSTQGALETAIDFAYDIHGQRCDFEKKIAALTAALAGMVRLFCCDGGTILAEHVESVEAVCALASIGAVEVLKDGGSWTEAVWK